MRRQTGNEKEEIRRYCPFEDVLSAPQAITIYHIFLDWPNLGFQGSAKNTRTGLSVGIQPEKNLFEHSKPSR